ncbi:GTPase domain-containing protein [Prevotella koreensis]|uniref:GTPase domain-containing protein n=1 Tax=Prevotella koreensis TaxID=2490854 RepID=UPI0028EDE611|nr:GTPase domain-containing protein [Prevotella koreensis]
MKTNNNKLIPSKESIEQGFKGLIDLLNETRSELYNIKGLNVQMSELMKPFHRVIEQEILKAQEEMINSMEHIRWDRLVIAFFGETNAGKSTIIETLRILFESNRTKGNDGIIVGDGRQDFTKDYYEYSLSINDTPFTLIDVPGIEGDEQEFKGIITYALRKAHCIFYVQGHNKKPDETTANKIKNYLGDWVNVYSIQNVRGAVTDYDEENDRIMLQNENVLKNGVLIEQRFSEILNGVYKGNIQLQALLAMCSKASFSPKRQDLLKTQQKLLKYFGSEDAVFQFSEFQNIINLIDAKSTNFKLEIAYSNRQKMYSLANGVIQSVNRIIKENQEKANNFENSLHTLNREIAYNFNRTKNSIRNKVHTTLATQFNKLQQSLFDVIDKDSSSIKQKKREVDKIVSDFKQNLSYNLSHELRNEIYFLRRKIDHAKRELEAFKFTNVDMSITSLQTDIDMEDLTIAVKELEIKLDDVTSFFQAVLGGAGVGLLGGYIVGAGIGAGVGGLIYVVKSAVGDNRKGSAKSLIQKTIASSKQKTNSEIQIKLRNAIDKLCISEKKLSKQVEDEINMFKKFNNKVTGLKSSIYKYEQNIKNFEYGKL